MFKLLIIVGFIVSAPIFAQIVKPHEDLFYLRQQTTYNKSSASVVKESLADYDRFVQLDVNSYQHTPLSIVNQDSNKPRVISLNEAVYVVNQANRNPVVALHMNSKYDPDNRGIGFCFGRAMFIHLYLAYAGVNRANIKKAFVVGPMSNGGWAWHVTTIVQSQDAYGREVWLALDPVAGMVKDVKSWYEYWLNQSDDGKLRLFIADSGKFGSTAGTYDERHKTNAFYNQYFNDMYLWFHANYQTIRMR